jgi:hypothetical protein
MPGRQRTLAAAGRAADEDVRLNPAECGGRHRALRDVRGGRPLDQLPGTRAEAESDARPAAYGAEFELSDGRNFAVRKPAARPRRGARPRLTRFSLAFTGSVPVGTPKRQGA